MNPVHSSASGEAPAFTDAKAQLWTWKTAEMRDYAVALVRCGLDRLNSTGHTFFGPDDLPEGAAPTGQGIAGAVHSCLLRASVIDAFENSLPDLGIRLGKRLSRHKSRNGAKVQLYTLRSRAIAETFLRRHGVSTKPVQQTFAFAA